MPKQSPSNLPAQSWTEAAAELLSENAYRALRDGTARGAVTKGDLAARTNQPSSTLQNRIQRAEGSGGRPLDLAVRYLFDIDTNGVRDNLALILDSAVETLRSPDADMEALFRRVLAMNFEFNSSQRVSFLPAVTVQAAASAFLQHEDPPSAELPTSRLTALQQTTRRAADQMNLRRDAYAEMTRLFTGLLRAAMRHAGRRPRTGFTAESIVVAIHSAHDGLLLRYHVNPDDVPLELAVETGWCIAMGMTEEGMYDNPGAETDPLTLRMIESALKRYRRQGGRVSVKTVARTVGVSLEEGLSRFPSDEDLERRCFSSLLQSQNELYELANRIGPEALGAVEDLLAYVAKVTDDYPGLPVAKLANIGLYEHLIEIVIAALSPTPLGNPQIMLDAPGLVHLAMGGMRNASQWQSIIDVYRNPITSVISDAAQDASAT